MCRKEKDMLIPFTGKFYHRFIDDYRTNTHTQAHKHTRTCITHSHQQRRRLRGMSLWLKQDNLSLSDLREKRQRGLMKISLNLGSSNELLIWRDSFNQLMTLLLSISKNCVGNVQWRRAIIWQYWYLALKISQYFVAIYWFSSKGFITLLITAWKHKQSRLHPVWQIRHSNTGKLLLSVMFRVPAEIFVRRKSTAFSLQAQSCKTDVLQFN